MPLYKLTFADPNRATMYHFTENDEEADRFVREVVLPGMELRREPDENPEESEDAGSPD